MLPGHTMHVGSIFPVAVAGGEKKPSEALHQPHLLHNQFVYVIVVVNPQMYTDGIFATGIWNNFGQIQKLLMCICFDNML